MRLVMCVWLITTCINKDKHCLKVFTTQITKEAMDSEVIKEKIHTEPLLNDPQYITLLSFIVLVFTVCK